MTSTAAPLLPPSGGYLQAIRDSSRQLRISAGIRVSTPYVTDTLASLRSENIIKNMSVPFSTCSPISAEKRVAVYTQHFPCPDNIRSNTRGRMYHITKPAIERLLQSTAFTSSFKRVSAVHGLNLPLKFDSHLDELNLISILSILNFASGYRAPLHDQLRRGAWDSIRAFVFSLFISSSSGDDLLSSRGMQSISVAKVAELMGVNLHIEKPHETLPGVIVGQLGGPLYELTTLITTVLNETGKVLVNGGYANLGSFVLEALKEGARAQANHDTSSLEVVLERLVKAFPAFQDMAVIEGQPIYCFKKALFLIHAIRIRFGSLSPHPFPIPETRDTPIFSDNVIPSLLVHLGVIDLSQAPGLNDIFKDAGSETRLNLLAAPTSDQPNNSSKEGPILSNDQAFKLRAAAIDACQMIIETAHSFDVAQVGANEAESLKWIRDITLPELDLWIWSVAKDRPDYRSLERFAQRNTVFY